MVGMRRAEAYFFLPHPSNEIVIQRCDSHIQNDMFKSYNQKQDTGIFHFKVI